MSEVSCLVAAMCFNLIASGILDISSQHRSNQIIFVREHLSNACLLNNPGL